MLTAASSWRECTGCFCLASPFNLVFTWATEITLHLNNCHVKCTRNVASESRRSSISAYPFREKRETGRNPIISNQEIVLRWYRLRPVHDLVFLFYFCVLSPRRGDGAHKPADRI